MSIYKRDDAQIPLFAPSIFNINVFAKLEKIMKHSFTTLMVYGFILVTQINAEAASTLKGFQFYMGMSGGMERMSGQRGEGLDEENQRLGAPNRTKTTYTSNLEMSEKRAVGSLIAGFLWKIPRVPIFIGPEVYVGSGGATSSFSDVRLDPFGADENRYYNTEFQRKLFAGALMRLGYQFCERYLAYLSFGLDRSQFSIKRALHHEQAVPATTVKRTKTLSGPMFGIGLERIFDQFVVGFDFKTIQYQKYNSNDDVRVARRVTPAFLNFSVRPKIKIFSLRVSYRF